MNKKTIIISGVVLLIALLLIFLLNKKNYEVTFDTDGGSNISTLVVKKGEKITRPTNPVKEGYTFVNWYLDGEEYDFSKEVTKNIKLTAKWTKNETVTPDDNKEPEKEEVVVKTYTVTFNTDGGSKVSSVKVNENEKVTKPTNPTKKGYKFLGWYLNNKSYNFSTKVTSDITLKAKWEKVKTDDQKEETVVVKTYTVTFNSDGGSKVSSATVNENTKVSKPANPTKDKYKFLGWYLDGVEYDFSKAVTKNITLTAKWEYVPTISYLMEEPENIVGQVILYVTKDGEKVDGYLDITVTGGKTITKEIPKTGYFTNKKQIEKITNARVK